MSALGAFGAIAALVAAIVPVGWLGARAERDERFARRLALGAAIAVLVTLGLTIARGELLRFAPGGGEIEECGASLAC